MSTIRVLTPDRLAPGLAAAWAAIQEADPELDAPFFRPEFTRAVAAVRPDVRVAVIEDEWEPLGFFPFQAGRLGVGKPVGGRLSDYHGVVAQPGLHLTPGRLLRACGLRSWAFDHVPVSQPLFAGHHEGILPAHHLDLSSGFEAYLAEKRAAKSGEVKNAEQALRRIERDLGPVRLETDCRDPETFRTLIRWKSEQYARTGLYDVFSLDWTVRLLERVWDERSEAFSGRLCVLRAGDSLLAAHFGMRSFGTLYWWFPAYEPAFSKYSPGGVLLYETARRGPEAGVTKIDLGKGEERYKLGFANGSRPLAEGMVYRSDVWRRVDGSWGSLRSWLKTGPLSIPVNASAKALRPLRERLSFR